MARPATLTGTEKVIKETIDHFKYLEVDFSMSLFPQPIYDGLKLIADSLVLLLQNFTTRLQTTVALLILNKFESSEMQTAYAIYVMLRSLCVTSYFSSICSKLAMGNSQCFGQNNYDQAKKNFTQSILVYSFYLLAFYLPLVLFSREILPIIGFDRQMIGSYFKLALKCFPADLIEISRGFLVIHCYSQKIEKEVALLAWLSFIASMTVTFFLTFYYHWGLDGWIIGRLVLSVLNFSSAIALYFGKSDKRTQGFTSLSESFSGILEFVWDTFSFWIGNLFEWIGWQLGFYFTALSHDNDQVAALGSMMNIVYFVFDMGSSFQTIGRTRVNYLLGAGHFKAAKKLLIIMIIAASFLAMIFGIILFVFRFEIVRMFASRSDRQLSLLLSMVTVYSLFAQVDINFKIMSGMARAANHVIFSTVNFGTITVCFYSAICWYLRTYKDADCTAYFKFLYILAFLALFILNTKLLLFDWSKIKLMTNLIPVQQTR